MLNLKRIGLCALAISAVLGAAGCSEKSKEIKEDTKPVAATPAPTAEPKPTPTHEAKAEKKEEKKEAAVDETKPLPIPPAEKVEVEGKPPSPKHIWVHGYWHWDGHEYQWHAGYWVEENAYAGAEPPALKVERPGVSPGTEFFYLPGYWRWEGKEYVWDPGRWARRREGYAYTYPHYEAEKGKWVRTGWGWEKEDAAWKKRYNGWAHHGELFVHKKDEGEFVKRGEREGWYHKK